ncbi:MAG: cysteine desulfurase [Flavobacteriaceae bacterium]|nr:cysteine desulfurase [Flavobacteriaceae bacterium]
MIYLDNAAGTPISKEVMDHISETMKDSWANPSSTHSAGRKAKATIEMARKTVAKCLNIASKHIIFTSGGTEGNNFVIKNACENLGVKTIITSAIEHPAVLESLTDINDKVNIITISNDKNGCINLKELEEKLQNNSNVMVSFMAVNNEIGTINPISEISVLCNKYNALFHSDAVQTIGKYDIDISGLDFAIGSSHKFHGPKGVGFIYYKNAKGLKSIVSGGGQEKGLRPGTENVNSIAGMAKAMEIAYKDIETNTKKVKELKSYTIESLQKINKDIKVNGGIDNTSDYILNIQFPFKKENMLFSLDLAGICISQGSACQSGASTGSHVLNALDSTSENTSIRISFSKYNTKEEIDEFIEVLTHNC